MKKGIIITIALLVVFSGFFVFKKFSKKPPPKVIPTPTPEEVYPTIAESEISVDLTAGPGNKSIFLKIDKYPKTASTIEYELTYDTEGVERGVMGVIMVEGTGPISREILLGTCSKNVCVYDKNVTKVKLVLRIETVEGVKSWSKEFSLIEEE